ncbi:hypothetical protein [Deinococcus sp.]|uniref:hypothetical protein n=1 Tax=Deinococcus sp. TaxID=47478 RepID=UPI0025C65F29|nr:hypothetical protein [Deinococcus sp.]
MKRLLIPALPLLLAACGSLSPAPTAGELLDAPTSLNVTGKVLTAQAAPTLSGNVFSVRVKVQTPKSALPGLNVTNLYVVTSDGVWSTAVDKTSQWKCGASCAFAVGRGPAEGLQSGDGVQVVLGLRDAQGRTFLLRDDQVKVK